MLGVARGYHTCGKMVRVQDCPFRRNRTSLAVSSRTNCRIRHLRTVSCMICTLAQWSLSLVVRVVLVDQSFCHRFHNSESLGLEVRRNTCKLRAGPILCVSGLVSAPSARSVLLPYLVGMFLCSPPLRFPAYELENYADNDEDDN
jgi:hypothetical protein